MDESKELLKKLISTKRNIKRKVMSMKRGVIDAEHSFNETFKPIIEPLTLIADSKSEKQSVQSENPVIENDEEDNLHKKSIYQFEHFFDINPENRLYDKTYGLHFDKTSKNLFIGEYPVEFIGDSHIIIDNHKYKWTFGLWSLLCEKTPKGVTQSDNDNYLGILSQTGVHLNKNNKPKSSSSFKWKRIVKPLYERLKNYDNLNYYTNKRRKLSNDSTHSADAILQGDSPGNILSSDPFSFESSTVKKGDGLYKGITDKVQLVYYDDPNELVTRLNLLSSSQNAGNTGVNNEIISILEELYERNLIT